MGDFNVQVGAVGLWGLDIEHPAVVVVVCIAFYEGAVSGWYFQHYITTMS